MISDGESQMPLLQFLLRGGGSVHRLDSDKSQYFAITEFNNKLFYHFNFDQPVYPWEAKRSVIFTQREKRGFVYE